LKRSASDDDVCRNEVAAAHTYYGMSDLKENDVLFVADSGATSHTTYSYRGTINKRENDVECLGATGEGIKTSLVDLPGQFIEEDGAVRSLARHMHAPTEEHNAALHYCMKYVVSTPERGLVLRPEGTWNGDKKYEFVVHGRSDSDYAGNTDDRRSISGGTVTVNGAHVILRSATQRFVTLSVTEAETAAGVMVAQDMMYVYRVLTSIGLRVRLPMVLELDNKGAVDLANNFSVGGRTRHMDVRNHFLRELKAEGLVVIRHVSGDDNEADIFTKNTATHVFNKHIVKFVGNDAYIGINSE